MKLKFSLLLVLLFFSLQAQVREGLNIPKNPKIGLSLSGGGAKGFAHIGVLKVIDSLGIKIDYISGTSMGAIIGGLYASGYTAKDIEKTILETNFYDILSNEKNRQDASFFSKATDKYLISLPVRNGKINIIPKSFSKGQKNLFMLKELFRDVSNITDFSKLSIPFMCVATNLETGKMKIFENGDLISSIMASSAFPSLLDPVKVKDSIYIDGAITVNYPSKPLKDKGMDIVIGVDLSQNLSSRDQLNSVLDILNQVIDFGIRKETKLQKEYTDININPNLNKYTATSYENKLNILKAGYTEAEKYAKTLEKLPKRQAQYLKAPFNPIFSNVYKIDSLSIENNNIFNKAYIQGKLGIKIPSMQTYGSINKMIDKLYATNNYNWINYDILQHNNKNYLHLNVEEEDTRYFLKAGLHYDEIFHSGLLINITAKRLLFRNSTISLDGVVGDAPRYYFNYFIDNGYIPGFGLYASGMTLEFKDNSDNVYQQVRWFKNEAYIQSIWKDKYAVGIAVGHDYFDHKFNTDYQDPKNYISTSIFVRSDTRDHKDFPSRGFYLNADVKVIDLLNVKLEEKLVQTKAKIGIHIPFSKNISFGINLFGGFTLSHNNIPYFKYELGGIFEQNLGNLAELPGYKLGEIISDNILASTYNLQYKFNKNFFLISSFSMANHFDSISLDNALRLNEKSIGITAGYRSPFGQIKLNYSTALTSNKAIFNVILGHWF